MHAEWLLKRILASKEAGCNHDPWLHFRSFSLLPISCLSPAACLSVSASLSPSTTLIQETSCILPSLPPEHDTSESKSKMKKRYWRMLLYICLSVILDRTTADYSQSTEHLQRQNDDLHQSIELLDRYLGKSKSSKVFSFLSWLFRKSVYRPSWEDICCLWGYNAGDRRLQSQIWPSDRSYLFGSENYDYKSR